MSGEDLLNRNWPGLLKALKNETQSTSTLSVQAPPLQQDKEQSEQSLTTPKTEARCSDWGSEEVASWLDNSGLASIKKVFLRHNIDGQALASLAWMAQADSGAATSVLCDRMKISIGPALRTLGQLRKDFSM